MKKRIASLFTSLLMIVSLMVVMPTMSVSASKSSATEIVSKADYLYNLTWSSQANFNGYINSKGTVTKYYSKGGVYRIPYGMPVNNGVFIGYGITPEAFINATKSSSNKFYTNRATYGSTNCNYYAMDCSTFVSYCWGLSTRHTTNSLPSVSKSLGKVSNSTVDSIQVGDAINKSDHVKLITDVVRDSNGKVIRIELTEETPPELKRTTISRDAFTSNNSSYTILRYADSLGATSSKPTNVILSKNQYWYDLKDTITLTPSSNGATSYVMSVEKDGKRIIDCISLNGAYSFAANKWGYGKYHAWISATNSAGTTDSSACDFEVVKAPSYSDVWCSKGFYDYDSNESIDIYIKASCTKGQTIGIDYLDENLNPVKRVVTSNCGNSYKISTKSLGKGYFSAYFTIWNGSGSVDTKRTYFYVGQKQNVGTDFYARIKNNAANKYLTNSNGNVNGTTLDCSKQQIWKFVRQSDNSYKLISAYDNGAMDVKDYATSGSGTNVQMNSSWDTNAQKFYIYYINKSYYFKPVCADLALDLSNKTSNLEVWGAGFNWNPQKFSIEKVNTNDIGVHKFSTWTTTKNATCTQVGTKSRKCTVCGKTETQTIAKTGHKSVTDKTISATCTTDGKTEGSHCSVCGAVIKAQDTIKATGHKFGNWTTTESATCTESGTQIRKCETCGATESKSLSAKGHTEVVDKAIPATCTTDGKTEGSHCSVCGAVIKAQDTIKATGHKFGNWTTTESATCTESGTQIRKCETCGATESKSLSAKGHTEVVDKAIPATCTTDGKTEGSHCSVCNTVIKVQTVINATGHKSSGWIVDKAASIGVKGSKHKECTVCKKVLETAEIPALPMINIQSANVSVSTNSYVFDNTAKKPSVTVKIGGKALKNGSDYTVSYLNNTKVGTATVRITGKGDYTGTITRNFTINPAKQQIQKLETRYKGLYIDWAQKGSATGYDVEYSVNANMNGAASRHLTANKPDTLTISGLTGDKTYYVRVRSYTNRNGKVYYGAWSDVKSIKTANNDITKVTVSGISTKAFTGKAITQNVTVKVGNTVLKNGTDYTVSYSNNKKVGNATVKITGKGKYGGVITKTFKINPAKQEIQKLTAKSKAFFIDWAQKGSATGYEIQYATNSKFTGAKKVTITNNKTDKTTVSKLSANKKYYVRVRSYTTVKGTKYYGAWSASKSVTTKK
ncbi:RICIN domain-containing protein [Ruminococcus bicirculans (ex Wegman et al. 2014)]|uniref:RICIN domain-containing protein n=2 Tax=Ruminococcus bicirculans (ex Wegman et al. 2014) TaxID=1160721 RepID=UPI00242F2FBC|nr:RICIN domain-containing protein [Ruminococcus bicirculans (ex Wegman et al. 2014)]